MGILVTFRIYLDAFQPLQAGWIVIVFTCTHIFLNCFSSSEKNGSYWKKGGGSPECRPRTLYENSFVLHLVANKWKTSKWYAQGWLLEKIFEGWWNCRIYNPILWVLVFLSSSVIDAKDGSLLRQLKFLKVQRRNRRSHRA